MKKTEEIIGNYVRIQRAEPRNPEAIHKGLQQGLRVNHPERITGYAGFFFHLGDVYAEKNISERMKYEPFGHFVIDAVKRYDKGDWGDISKNDEDENIENRYMFGIDRLFGRYVYYASDKHSTPGAQYDDVICIRMHEGATWVTYESGEDWFLFLEKEHMEKIRDSEACAP